MKDQARVVIIGGGIFGTSVAYHLAEAGCTDVVLVDKGELTSGTTFHSVGLVSQFRTSPSLMRVMNYTIRLFNRFKKEAGNSQAGDALGWRTVGSLRLASSPDRLKGLKREVSRARAIGIDAEMVSPKEALKIAPFMSDKGLYGAVYVPDDGHIDPSGITYELARRARLKGVEIHTNVRVTDITVSPSKEVTKVVTDKGEIRTPCVVNAAGEWTPRIGAMVGVHIPMVPLMHQYVTTKPIPGRELPKDTPVVRDPDKLFYCREDVGAYLVGGFETNPKAWCEKGVDWSFNQQLLPGEWELFGPVFEMAMERIPNLADAEVVELVNGPDAFTPDGHYALGPVPGLKGFFVAAGGSINGIAGAGGVGKLLSEWILEGEPSIDTHEMDVRRFGPHLKHLPYLTQQCREVYRYYYHMRFPHDENEWGRPLRKSPFYQGLKALGAVFGEKNGWERVNYFDPEGTWRMAGADQQEWGWTKPPFFDQVGKEARAARHTAALLDMSSFGKTDVKGPGALALLQHLCPANLKKAVGHLTYTQFLNPKGGIEGDVTVCPMGPDHFRVISGTSFGPSDMGWMISHMPGDGSVEITDTTEAYGCLSLCGPSSREILASVADEDVSNAAFPYMTARSIRIRGKEVWAQRISYTGELGWELYMAPADGPVVMDALMAAGQAFHLMPMGYKALESLRIEKGFLYYSSDITPEDNPLEAGLGFCVDFTKPEFVGKEALKKIRDAGLKMRLCALVLDSRHGLFGGESVYHDGKPAARIRSAAFGHFVRKDIGLAYLPKALARPGTEFQVEVLGKRMPAACAALPLVDPEGAGIRS